MRTPEIIKMEQFNYAVMQLKDADGMANKADAHQTALKRESELYLYCTDCSDLSVPKLRRLR